MRKRKKNGEKNQKGVGRRSAEPLSLAPSLSVCLSVCLPVWFALVPLTPTAQRRMHRADSVSPHVRSRFLLRERAISRHEKEARQEESE